MCESTVEHASNNDNKTVVISIRKGNARKRQSERVSECDGGNGNDTLRGSGRRRVEQARHLKSDEPSRVSERASGVAAEYGVEIDVQHRRRIGGASREGEAPPSLSKRFVSTHSSLARSISPSHSSLLYQPTTTSLFSLKTKSTTTATATTTATVIMIVFIIITIIFRFLFK